VDLPGIYGYSQNFFWHLTNIDIRNILTEIEDEHYKNTLSKCKKITSDED
jgi:hypothetical protein